MTGTDDDFEDDSQSVSDRRTLLHSKDLLASIVALVERPNPSFLAVTGTGSLGHLYPLRDGYVIGRAVGADVPLREEGVSRRHGVVRVTGEAQVRIADLGSSNGIFVNGTKIEGETAVREGDFVQIGSTVLMLVFLGHRAEGSLAALDPITLLPRRGHFVSELAEEFRSARSQDLSLSLTLFSVEGLDRIEQRHGYQAVEDLLSRIARIVRDTVQGNDPLVARYSDDEFAILVTDSEPIDADGLHRWLSSLSQSNVTRVRTNAEPESIAMAIGQVQLRPDHATYEDVLREARRALYLDRARALDSLAHS